MNWIDTHCHLDYDYSPKTVEDLVREAEAAGVSHLVTIGTQVQTSLQLQSISERFPNVYHTVGVHPHDATTTDLPSLGALKAASIHPKCKGIGEIGLDYYYKHSSPDEQKQIFRAQLILAQECKLPVVIHCRDAEDDTLAILEDYANTIQGSRIPGIIHCFSGTRVFGEACLQLGFYLSFSGIVTFKNAKDLHESAKLFPLEKMLVETDSPYLAPIPFRGKKCEPSMVRHTGEKIAELKGLPVEEVARITTENARRIFNF